MHLPVLDLHSCLPVRNTVVKLWNDRDVGAFFGQASFRDMLVARVFRGKRWCPVVVVREAVAHVQRVERIQEDLVDPGHGLPRTICQQAGQRWDVALRGVARPEGRPALCETLDAERANSLLP